MTPAGAGFDAIPLERKPGAPFLFVIPEKSFTTAKLVKRG